MTDPAATGPEVAAMIDLAAADMVTMAGAAAPAADAFAGAAVCRDCHAGEYDAWAQSHHRLAMQAPTPGTVLGDFDDATFTHDGVATRFFRDGDRYRIETGGANGARQTYDVRYTFGAIPLQQYLVDGERGRLQAFTIAWDARPESSGGGRWYALYPDEPIPPGDPLHWTGRFFTWNAMCADCHSTGLRKQYDPGTDSYDTHWQDINVACEACHGPGARHASAMKRRRKPVDSGFAGQVSSGGVWRFADGAPIATTIAPGRDAGECVACHARRTRYGDDPRPSPGDLDIALVERGLYHADGQILDEVYVYGSFLQSRMHQAGVTCIDCHEPHTLGLRAPGAAVCQSCHSHDHYASAQHHGHESGTADCVSCHMPARVYMGVDERHDHGFRIPRPDLTPLTGAPSTCATCHSDRDGSWIAAGYAALFGKTRDSATPRPTDNFPVTFARADDGSLLTMAPIVRVATDRSLPPIIRASALARLRGTTDPAVVAQVAALATDADPLVRREIAALFSGIPAAMRPAGAIELASDNAATVRRAAAPMLLDPAGQPSDPEQRARRDALLAAHIDTLSTNLDDPGALVELASIDVARGELGNAVTHLEKAIALAPYDARAWVNLADVYRLRNAEDEAQALLARGMSIVHEPAPLHHAMALSLVRQRRYDVAIEELETATRIDPQNPTYAMTLAIALNSGSSRDRAIGVLDDAHQRLPRNAEILVLLARIGAQQGRSAVVDRAVRELATLDATAADAIMAELRGAKSRPAPQRRQ